MRAPRTAVSGNTAGMVGCIVVAFAIATGAIRRRTADATRFNARRSAASDSYSGSGGAAEWLALCCRRGRRRRPFDRAR